VGTVTAALVASPPGLTLTAAHVCGTTTTSGATWGAVEQLGQKAKGSHHAGPVATLCRSEPAPLKADCRRPTASLSAGAMKQTGPRVSLPRA